MNEDELARLLRATPDEPALPSDPVAVVRRRATQVRRRKQLVAGGLAAVLVAAAGGAVVGAAGARTSGRATVLREATDPPTVSGTDPAPSASPTALTTTVAAAVADTSPLHWTWDVHVVGTTVTVGGEWSGVGATLTAKDIANDVAPSPGAVAGSGVESWNASSEIWPLIWNTNGDTPACTGPVEEQHRSLPTRTYTNVQQGTYTLSMYSGFCGAHDGPPTTTTVTIGPGATPAPSPPSFLGFGYFTVDSATVTVGQPLAWHAYFLGTPSYDAIDYVGADGPVGFFIRRNGMAGPACRTQSDDVPHVSVDGARHTFDKPGTYAFLWRWSCDAPPAETGPDVPQDGATSPGAGPGFGGNVQDAERLAESDPVHNRVVVVTVLPAASSSASASASASATPATTATTPGKTTEKPTVSP